MPFKVFVDDNFHYMDEGERYALGEFETAEAALSAAKTMVDEDLKSFYKNGMPAVEVYSQYTMFGVDPFIISDGKKVEFSARTYARIRSEELFGSHIEALSQWFRAEFDDAIISLHANPPERDPWQADVRWDSIIRVCFKAGDFLGSDEIYIFSNERPESYVVPIDANGGSDLWFEIIRRRMFDAELAIRSASATGELFCWPQA